MENKRFVVFHSAGAFVTKEEGKDELRIMEGQEAKEYFSDARGYDEEDIEAINELYVGEMWQSPDYGHYHWVVRIDDAVEAEPQAETEPNGFGGRL